MDGNLINGFSPNKDPLSLSTATIFVPSRRAARALTSSLINYMEIERAVLLPKIRTLGDVSDEEFGLEIETREFTELPETIEPISRRLELANLVHQWVEKLEDTTRELYNDEDIVIPSSRSDALRLADDLCVLMSQIFQEEINWDDVLKIVPDDFTNWWQLTSEFLKIVAQYWPEYLKEKNLIDPAERSAQLLNLRATNLETQGSKGPVIIAGSTGSVPSTQRLLKAVSQLENGAVVLPGLDKSLSNEEWQKLSYTKPSDDPAIETHPQFGLAKLLENLKVEREKVVDLNLDGKEPNRGCREIISMALTPASFTSKWIKEAPNLQSDKINETLSHLTLIDAGNERSEALAIAVAMRETLETPDKTAALLTPDRNLAQRVSTELRRFNIIVDDTGGTPLANSKPAVFMRLILETLYGSERNPGLASMLKSPFCLMGYSPSQALKFGQNIELIGLRGVINPIRLGNLQQGLVRRKQELADASFISKPVQRLTDEDWIDLFEYAGKLDEAFKPLSEFKDRSNLFSISEIVFTIQNALAALTLDDKGESAFLDVEGGAELQDQFEKLIETTQSTFQIVWQDIPSILDALLSGTNTRPRSNAHPRLHIYGPLEMRLLDYDRVILGGLNEGTWPQSVRNDAFINRSMRHELGMASPERRTGLSAHDFQQLMGKSEIILSRASRVDKAPTVLSRWLQRMAALIGKDCINCLVKRGNKYLEFAEALDHTLPNPQRIKRPCPTPPVASRPTGLSVTDIETWIRDPYAIYAKKILDLQPIEALEREPDPMLKGTVYHRIMQYYIESNPLKLEKSERLKLLIDIADEVIDEENLSGEISQTWKLRWKEIAAPYIDWELLHEKRFGAVRSHTELKGSVSIGEVNFKLSARADRIDITDAGDVYLLDYKTGNNPSASQARTLSPQLALEGFIASHGQFEGISETHVLDLVYMRLRRGNEFKNETISKKDIPVDTIITNAADELLKLVKGYQFQEQGYLSRRVPFKEGDISGDYDHLARTREWSFGEEEDGDV